MELSSGQSRVLRFFEHLARVNSFLERALSVIAAGCLGGFSVSVLILVLFRQVIKYPLLAPFEITVFLFVWSVFTAGAVGTRRKLHFCVDFLPSTLPQRFEHWNLVLIDTLYLVFSLFLLIYGVPLVEGALGEVSPINQYSMAWAATAIPVAAAAMVLFTLEHLLRDLHGLPVAVASGAEHHGMFRE